MRTTHRLAPNDEQSTPKYRIYLDIVPRVERLPSGTDVHTFGAAWVCAERRRSERDAKERPPSWQRLSSLSALWMYLDSKAYRKSLTYVYAYNYDYLAGLLALDTESTRAGWRCTRWAQNKQFLFARFQASGGNVMFVDSRNYYAGPLDKLADELGVEVPRGNPDGELTDEAERPTIRNVVALRTLMRSLFSLAEGEKWGRFKPTLPGVAWSAWRHTFMTRRPLVIADERLAAFERSAYAGGRTEVFREGRADGPLYQLDVNSMYPHAMREGLYPLEKVYSRQLMTIGDLAKALEDFCVIARVRLHASEPVYPVREAGKLTFPLGAVETTLCTSELAYALDHGAIRAVGRVVVYKRTDLFAGYVSHFYAAREGARDAHNRPLELAYKLLLNSLYGKFGQRQAFWERCQEVYPSPRPQFLYDCQASGTPLDHRVRYGDVWHLVHGGESRDSLPAIAAHITSFARSYLWLLIARAGREHVYYVDTDSLFVDDQGLGNLSDLLHPRKLGALKLAGEYAWADFRGPKNYATPDRRVVAGVRADAVELGEDTYCQARQLSYATMLSRGVDGVILVKPETRTYGRVTAR